ncbi:MAG: hypothetical protein L3J10_07860 [Sulfurimonas sp.]|nr:hypothetical protein [Sulfurimonas sp.]
MKIISLMLLLIFLTINLYADKNWIEIEPINKTKTVKPKTKLDVNLSQIEPINKMMKKVTVFKQLIDATGKKEKVKTNDKNWYILNK